MRQINRVEPKNNGGRGEVARATMTTTTHIEITRRVEVVPINKTVARSHTDTRLPSRMWTDIPRVSTSISPRRSGKTLCCIGCLFITTGILALFVVITSLLIAYRMTQSDASDIERYDMGDLYYGVNNANQIKYPSVEINKDSIQKYLSDQLINEPGFRGLVIDGVLVQHQLSTQRRNQRDSSCSTIFIIRNIQVYFDHCSTCSNERNLVIGRSLSNITAFRQPLYLLINDRYISTQICSISNLSHFIVPINTNLKMTAMDSKYISSTRSMYILTSRTRKTTASTSSPFKSTVERLEVTSYSPEISSIDLSEALNSTTNDLSKRIESDSFRTKETSTSSIDYSTETFTTNEFPVHSSTRFPDESSTSSHKKQTTTSKKSARPSITTLRKTTWTMFQFLPHRPITRHVYNSSTMNGTWQRTTNKFELN